MCTYKVDLAQIPGAPGNCTINTFGELKRAFIALELVDY